MLGLPARFPPSRRTPHDARDPSRPLVFPIELGVLLSAALGLLACALLAPAARPSDTSAAEAASARNTLWNALLWGLLAARLGYLWQYRDAYLPEPLSMLDLRDGGWNGLIGLAAAWAYALATILRRRAPWRLTLAALAVASLVWLGGRALIAPPAPQSHPALAELVLSDLQGAPASLAAFRGKPAVVNLWASWCRAGARCRCSSRRRPGIPTCISCS